MVDFAAILNSPYTKGMVSGVITAAAVDIQAFRSWKSFQDAADYSWSKALFRWLQGAGVGLITAAGLGAFFGP